jgi:hypothetical protein
MPHYRYHDDLNNWDGSGTGPNIGTDDNPSETPTNGYNNSSPQSTPLNVPGTDDYTGWNWEQILNGVLGLTLPSRQDVANLRWTVTDSNMNEDTSLFKIFGAAWDQLAASDRKDFLVYLNPGLQAVNGPWDEYYNIPANRLADMLTGPGGNWSGIAVDPKDFNSAAVALLGVEVFYMNAAAMFDDIATGLSSEASQYQGAAGETFYQLMSNLNSVAQSIRSQIIPNIDASYGERMLKSGMDTYNFVVGLYNALSGWASNNLDFSPLGAIYQALINGNVVQGDGSGSYSVPQSLSALTGSSFGNLLSDAGWLSVETAAKQLWLNTLNSGLDQVAVPLVINLSDSYLNTAAITRPLNPPAISQIGASNVNDNFGADFNSLANSMDNGFSDLGTGLGNIGDGLGAGFNGIGNGLGDLSTGLGNIGDGLGAGFNGIGDGLGDLSTGLGNIGDGLGAGFNGVGDGLGDLSTGLGNIGDGLGAGFNGVGNGLGDLSTGLGNIGDGLGAGFNGVGNGLGDLSTGLGNVTGGLNSTGGLGDLGAGLGNVAGGLNSAGGLGASTLLTDSLGNPGATTSGLQSALGDNTTTGQALSANVPGATSIEQALASNGQVQSALQQALASGQVPSTGPLQSALQSALADSGNATTALNQALAGGGTPASIQQAIADNKAAQTELQQALASGQVPSTGPLHNELQSALADTRSVGTALNQALTSTGTPVEVGNLLGSAGSGGGGLGSLAQLFGGGQGLTANLGGQQALTAGIGGAAGVGGATGLTGGTGAAVSSGSFTAPQAQTSGEGTSAVPFYPPMAGGMGMSGGQQGLQERERTTWLSEDEDVWGTEPSVGPGVLGRDFTDADDDLDEYEEYERPVETTRRSPSRAQTR